MPSQIEIDLLLSPKEKDSLDYAFVHLTFFWILETVVKENLTILNLETYTCIIVLEVET